MDCKEFRELLGLYIDGELSAEANYSARAHLAGCVTCRRVHHQLSLLRYAVKRFVNQNEPPPGLVHNVSRLARPGWRRLIPRGRARRQTIIEGAETNSFFWRKKIAVPTPGFALLLAAVLGLLSWILTQRPNGPSPGNHVNLRKAVSVPASPVPGGGFDLSQFDRGERAAIYKIRPTDRGNRER